MNDSTSNEQDRPGLACRYWIGPLVAVVSIAMAVVLWFAALPLAFNVAAVVVISVVIWQACDPFADAAQWIGNRLHLPGSVRGATLDAVASSLPELFTGTFFVVVAMTPDPTTGTPRAEAGGEGYGSTVATCAGSAVYNMILIPAFVTLVVSFARKERPTIDVEEEVIARDGVASLLCQFLLVILLFLNELHWWMGLIFIAAYCAYVWLLYGDWKRFEVIKGALLDQGVDTDTQQVLNAIRAGGNSASPWAIDQVRNELKRRGTDGDQAEDEDRAGMLFGLVNVPLNDGTAWTTIAVSTAVAAAACYFLVEVTHNLADILDVPTFFMAVIVAAAASSVPDTFLSIGAALRGDDSGAVSNAFGSNIFDICICLSLPLILNCALNDWRPISLLQDGKPIEGLVGLRILLGVLTTLTLMIMWHNRQLTRRKAVVLCLLYGVFIAYAVVGSLGLIEV